MKEEKGLIKMADEILSSSVVESGVSPVSIKWVILHDPVWVSGYIRKAFKFSRTPAIDSKRISEKNVDTRGDANT